MTNAVLCPDEARPPRRVRRGHPITMDDLRQDERACLTMADVARVLNLDVRTVSRACADGQLPSIEVGRRTLIPRERLIAVLEAR